jgi:TPR repeat protein
VGTLRSFTSCAAALLVAAGSAYADVKLGMDALAKRDFAEARRQFEAAGSQPDALFQLARLAQFGIGEPLDEAKALQLYSRAWEAGHQPSGLAAARILASSPVATIRDEKRGMAIMKQLADSGMSHAQYLYGFGLQLGRYGLEKDEAAAIDWFRRAMENGSVEALVRYADALALGRGVPKDEAKAFEIVRNGSQRDDSLVIVAYGRMLARGMGTARDEAEAFKQFKRAAELGAPEGQYEVAASYLFGRGVTRDPDDAARWMDAAARNGNVNAQRMYGEMFRLGTGVPQSNIQAYKWFTIAYNGTGGNFAAANEARARLAANMSTAQIQDATRQANGYRQEVNVRPLMGKAPELAKGERVDIGGRTLYAPLPEGYVNAWQIIERMRKLRPNLDGASADTLLVAMASEDIDRLKLGLRVEELRTLELVKYPADESVNVSSALFADIRKQFKERMQARIAQNRPRITEKAVREDGQVLLVMQTEAPNTENIGGSVGLGLLLLNGRVTYIRVLGAAGTPDGEERTLKTLTDWTSILLRAN